MVVFRAWMVSQQILSQLEVLLVMKYTKMDTSKSLFAIDALL